VQRDVEAADLRARTQVRKDGRPAPRSVPVLTSVAVHCPRLVCDCLRQNAPSPVDSSGGPVNIYLDTHVSFGIFQVPSLICKLGVPARECMTVALPARVGCSCDARIL
jgi:hypothetical protein